jgi:sulfate transport system ATP-binding protein
MSTQLDERPKLLQPATQDRNRTYDDRAAPRVREARAANMSITIESVSKEFGNYPALKGVSLNIDDGEFVALLGPSGSGKTTLLRIIAGLEYSDHGSICFGDRDVTRLPASDRGIGFVFQHYALFGHMTVADNIAFGLKVMKRRNRPSKKEIRSRAEALLDLVQLPGLGKRYPAQLSGGQRQRVALARALAREPDFLLLDEPFGALDAKVRKELREALKNIHKQIGVTSIFVTHDRDEAFALSDRVAILNAGTIEQFAPPTEIRQQPASEFVKTFIAD